jgi:Ca2+/Na+ antiporter
MLLLWGEALGSAYVITLIIIVVVVFLATPRTQAGAMEGAVGWSSTSRGRASDPLDYRVPSSMRDSEDPLV